MRVVRFIAAPRRLAALLLCVALVPAAWAQDDSLAAQDDRLQGQEDGVQAQDREVEAQSDRVEAQRWWGALSPDQRNDMRRRWDRVRELSPELRAEMRRRMSALRQMRREVWRSLTAEERASLREMAPAEQERFFEARLRLRLEEQSRRLEEVFPGVTDQLRDLPLDERVVRSARLIEGHRRSRLIAEVEKIAAEGWLGPSALDWLRDAPLHEVMSGLRDARKWHTLERARREGVWEKLGLDERRQRSLIELPSGEFLRTFSELRKGRPWEEVFGEAPAWGRRGDARRSWSPAQRNGREHPRRRPRD